MSKVEVFLSRQAEREAIARNALIEVERRARDEAQAKLDALIKECAELGDLGDTGFIPIRRGVDVYGFRLPPGLAIQTCTDGKGGKWHYLCWRRSDGSYITAEEITRFYE